MTMTASKLLKRVTFAAGVVAGLLGCASTPKSKPDTTAERGTLVQQRMCSEQAKKSFEDSSFSDDKTATYTNHFDLKTNVCYEEVATRSQASEPQAPSSYNLLVLDAFENRVYAEFAITYSGYVAGQWNPERVYTCRIIPRDKSQIDCKSREEFDRLVLQYFGTVPD